MIMENTKCMKNDGKTHAIKEIKIVIVCYVAKKTTLHLIFNISILLKKNNLRKGFVVERYVESIMHGLL